ncbi:hypothetical protein [Paracoccus yeei]
MTRQIEGCANLPFKDDVLLDHRLDLGENTEAIYRREVLDFL